MVRGIKTVYLEKKKEHLLTTSMREECHNHQQVQALSQPNKIGSLTAGTAARLNIGLLPPRRTMLDSL